MTPAAAKLKRWRENVAAFAYEEFKFEPDAWQKEFFDVFPSQDEDKKQIALKACTGPGKTVVLDIVALNFMACYGDLHEHPQGLCLSITGGNLHSYFWPGLKKLQNKSEFFKDAFTWTSKRFSCNGHSATWFLEAKTFGSKADPETLGRTLSGFHPPFGLIVLDELGDIPVPVYRGAQQCFSARYRWMKICGAGNPTSRLGSLFHVCTKDRKRTYVITITGDPDDLKRSPRVDLENAKEAIRIYGRENPWVKATILGEFPDTDPNALLSVEKIEEALDRHIPEDQYAWAQKRLGIDAAWHGDDRWVIWPRQGKASFRPRAMRNPKTQDVGNRIIAAKLKFASQREYFDNTGGFSQGAFDYVENAGYDPVAVQFAGPDFDPTFYNCRSGMWWRAAQAIKQGAALPRTSVDGEDISGELIEVYTTVTYSYQKGKLIIEPKPMIKARLGYSPDYCDANGLTYFEPDMPGGLIAQNDKHAHAEESDPYRDEVFGNDDDARAKADFDPYRDTI